MDKRYTPKLIILILTICGGLIVSQTTFAQNGDWKLADSPMDTPWTQEVGSVNALPEYPWPMMVRDSWKNLNGLWDFSLTSKNQTAGEYDREILVPYPGELALSRVMEEVGTENRMWYKRTFSVDDKGDSERVLLHFGEVDWHTHVFVNGEFVGEHKGGYSPLNFDITNYLVDGEQESCKV